jgi:hypothetical protein
MSRDVEKSEKAVKEYRVTANLTKSQHQKLIAVRDRFESRQQRRIPLSEVVALLIEDKGS